MFIRLSSAFLEARPPAWSCLIHAGMMPGQYNKQRATLEQLRRSTEWDCCPVSNYHITDKPGWHWHCHVVEAKTTDSHPSVTTCFLSTIWRHANSVSTKDYKTCPLKLLLEFMNNTTIPRGVGVPPFAFAASLSIHFLIFCSLLLFPFFLFSFTLLIFLYCPSDPFLPESSHSVSRREVVGGDRTWV